MRSFAWTLLDELTKASTKLELPLQLQPRRLSNAMNELLRADFVLPQELQPFLDTFEAVRDHACLIRFEGTGFQGFADTFVPRGSISIEEFNIGEGI
jgi:hypothetical protein